MATLSLISLNIERDNHLERFIPWLERMRADVVCLQELFEPDIPRIEAVCGPCFYVPMNKMENARGIVREGVGIFSRFPLRATAFHQYAGTPGDLIVFDGTDLTTKIATQRYVVALASVEKEGKTFRVATTHFPWTPDGSASDAQRAALAGLFEVLASESEFVICGDFNAPRGREIFSALAERFTDNIPLRYTSSIDGSLHRAGALPLMVDGLFSTKRHRVSGVELHSGMSDHCAISAHIV